MIEYNKIETVYNRETTGSKKLIIGDFRNPLIEYLQNNLWVFTEKIDGTNISVCWDGHNIEFHGRTDKAVIPTHLLNKLTETFSNNETEELFEQLFGDKQVILFGEGYGYKIQNGGLYRNDVSFILFDVLVNGVWLNRGDVENIAKAFNIEIVPIVLIGTLQEGIEFVKQHPKSTIGNADMEGVVGRTFVEITDKIGNRAIVKIKYRDFSEVSQ